MPTIELPNSQSAVIARKEDISERASRNITRAYMAAAGAASRLSGSGFDETNPSTWGVFADISEQDQNALDGYQAALVVNMVRSWTLGELPTLDSVLDLPKATFDALVAASSDEFNRITEFGPDGVNDPKADTAE
jgi:hypothetical protein